MWVCVHVTEGELCMPMVVHLRLTTYLCPSGVAVAPWKTSDSFAHAQFTSRRVLTVGKRQICAASRANISQLFPAALTAGRVAPAHGVIEQPQTGKGAFLNFIILAAYRMVIMLSSE